MLFQSQFGMGVLLQICCIFSEQLFVRTPLEGCFWTFFLCFLHWNQVASTRKPLNHIFTLESTDGDLKVQELSIYRDQFFQRHRKMSQLGKREILLLHVNFITFLQMNVIWYPRNMIKSLNQSSAFPFLFGFLLLLY